MTNVAGIASSNRLQLQFAYDYLGRRISKAVFNWNGSGFGPNPVRQTTFVYDGWNLVTELKPNNSLLRSYVWGSDLSGSMQGAGGVGGLLIQNVNGTNCFPAYDGNGNVMALVNAADGTVAANYDYAAFGEPIRITGAMAQNNPFRFSTKYADDETDLLYYGYRYYKPSTGTWPNRDPLEEQAAAMLVIGEDVGVEGDINEYGFVSNDSIDTCDLLGLKQIGQPIPCGNCLICIDNDSASGDGNSYKIHWNCGKKGRPQSCRGGGSAQWPSGDPSHGGGSVPNNIKKCLKKTRWALQPKPIPVADKCSCKQQSEKLLVPAAAAAGGCVAGYGIYKILKTCGGGVVGLFVAGPPGAWAGVEICIVTP